MSTENTNEVNETPAVPETTHNDVYWKYLDELEGKFRAFLAEARAGDINKQACLRARKLSVNLRRDLKEYRVVGVAHDKTHGRKKKTEVQLDKEIGQL